MTVHVNSFAHRQTEDSRFSYYDGTLEQLTAIVSAHLDPESQKGKNQVLTVPVPPEGFFSAVVKLQEGDKLVGGFDPRRPGENPRKWVAVPGSRKMPAKSVNIILYPSELLAEKGDNELAAEEGNWEIISINASPFEDGKERINPETLMYNYFGLDGGTDPNLTLEEFVEELREACIDWCDKAMCAGS